MMIKAKRKVVCFMFVIILVLSTCLSGCSGNRLLSYLSDYDDYISLDYVFENLDSTVYAMTDYLEMTFGELIDLYGTDYNITQTGDGGYGRTISYESDDVPFDFTIYIEDIFAESPESNEEISVVSVSPSSGSTYSINGDINTDITYSKLCESTSGTHWVNDMYALYHYASENYVYTCEFSNVSIDFAYEQLPDDDSVADTIVVEADRSWNVGSEEDSDWSNEDNICYILYQQVVDEYYITCIENHISCNCSWALCDIDGDGLEELIVQDGESENGRTQHIYTIKNREAVELGNYNAWHLTLYDDVKGDGELIGVDGMTMSGNIYSIIVSDERVTREIIKSFEDVSEWPTYSNLIEFTDISEPLA